MLRDLHDVPGEPSGFRNTFEDGREVPNGNPLGQQVLQDPLNSANRNLVRDKVADQFLMRLVQVVEQFLRFRVGQQFRHVVADELGQMGGHDGGGVDDGVAPERCFFAMPVLYPHGGQSEGRLHCRFTVERDRFAARVHHEQHVGTQFANSGFDFLDAHHILIRRQLKIILNAHRRHDEAHLHCELPAKRLDLIGKAAFLRVVDQRQ